MTVWVATEVEGTDLGDALHTPERLLADPAARFVKDHARTAVAEISVDGREVFVKRWKPHRWYRPLIWLFTGTPARQSRLHAAALARAGFRVPVPLAIAETRAGGLPSDSYFVTEAVAESQPVGRFWREQASSWPISRRAAFLAALAGELSRFHAAGFYSRDANADNFLVRWRSRDAPEFYLLDLENVRRVSRVSRRRRVKNLVQLYRPARGMVRRLDQLRFLRVYFGVPLARRRDWLGELAVFDEQKEREYARRRAARR